MPLGFMHTRKAHEGNDVRLVSIVEVSSRRKWSGVFNTPSLAYLRHFHYRNYAAHVVEITVVEVGKKRVLCMGNNVQTGAFSVFIDDFLIVLDD